MRRPPLSRTDRIPFAAFAVVLIVVLTLGIGGWRLERWLNWKLFYGAKVDRRIEMLERRITALEREHVEMCRRDDCPICNGNSQH